MKMKNVSFGFFQILVSIVLITSFAVQSVSAQCGNYFKTKYQKTLPDLSDYQVEDWTGDGKADFWKFQLNPNTNRQDVVIYANNGGGEFAWDNPFVTQTTIPVIRENLDSYELLDFNSDGKKDILFSQRQGPQTVYLNNGSNSFSALAENTFNDEPGSNYLRSFGFVDLNGDNILDWFRINTDSNNNQTINYRLGSASGTFGARTDVFTLNEYIGLIGDFNGDGRKDIARGTGGPIYVKLNNGNGTLSNEIESSVPFRTNNATVADFNADGKDEIVSTEATGTSGVITRYLLIFNSDNTGHFMRSELPVYQFCCGSEADYAVKLKIADFNGDNSPDILELHKNFYSVHLNNGQGTFTRTDYFKKLGEAQDLIFAKFSGDNKADIFVKSNASAQLKNIFNERVIVIKHNQCDSFGETKRANFNGDLLPDLATWNPDTGNWRIGILVSNPPFAYATTDSFTWGRSGDVPALGDYDGDGKTDYSVYRPSEGNWYILLSSNSSWLVSRFGLPGDIPVPSDYDGGGKTDIAVFRPSDGNWYLLMTETQQFLAAHFGANGDKPVPADYDGDGKTDIAVYRPGEGNWYYLRSSDLNYSVVHWGISTDKPIPADYDGDGRADLAVYRDGDWYILRSSNNSFNFIHLGSATDFPIPLYFNGDFAELTVYRATSIYWYRYFSGSFPNEGISFGQAQYTPIYFGLPNN